MEASSFAFIFKRKDTAHSPTQKEFTENEARPETISAQKKLIFV